MAERVNPSVGGRSTSNTSPTASSDEELAQLTKHKQRRAPKKDSPRVQSRDHAEIAPGASTDTSAEAIHDNLEPNLSHTVNASGDSRNKKDSRAPQAGHSTETHTSRVRAPKKTKLAGVPASGTKQRYKTSFHTSTGRFAPPMTAERPSPVVEELLRQVSSLESNIRQEVTQLSRSQRTALLDLVTRLKVTLQPSHSTNTAEADSSAPSVASSVPIRPIPQRSASLQTPDEPIEHAPTSPNRRGSLPPPEICGEPYMRLGRVYQDAATQTYVQSRIISVSAVPAKYAPSESHSTSKKKATAQRSLTQNDADLQTMPVTERRSTSTGKAIRAKEATETQKTTPTAGRRKDGAFRKVVSPGSAPTSEKLVERLHHGTEAHGAPSDASHGSDSVSSEGLQSSPPPAWHTHFDLLRSLDESEEELRRDTRNLVISPSHLDNRLVGPSPLKMLKGGDNATAASSSTAGASLTQTTSKPEYLAQTKPYRVEPPTHYHVKQDTKTQSGTSSTSKSSVTSTTAVSNQSTRTSHQQILSALQGFMDEDAKSNGSLTSDDSSLDHSISCDDESLPKAKRIPSPLDAFRSRDEHSDLEFDDDDDDNESSSPVPLKEKSAFASLVKPLTTSAFQTMPAPSLGKPTTIKPASAIELSKPTTVRPNQAEEPPPVPQRTSLPILFSPHSAFAPKKMVENSTQT